MQKIYPLLALAAGLLIAYVDSQPHWDDTGITVFALLAASGLLGLLARRRPWLIALAVGLPIPLRAILVGGNYAMLITLLFPFVGAYAGWGLRKVIRRTQHTA